VSKVRVEAFSDGVMAVAITLLALDLHVPDPAGRGSLAHRLGEQWPNYAAYIVSFVTIGIIWINHHAMLRRLVTVDHTIMVLNVVLLLTIGVLPFSTALMAEYPKVAHGQNHAAVIYGGSFLAMALAFFAMQRHLLLAKQHLLHDHLTPDLRRVVLRRNAAGLMPYAAATPAGILSPYLTLAICLPWPGFTRCPGRHPTISNKWTRGRWKTRFTVRDLLGRRSRRGRAVRLVAAILLGLALARALGAFGFPAGLRVVPVAALVACLLMRPRNLN
jgi:uncharacterized membrane protein